MSNDTDPKTIAVVSYITLIGWIVAIVLHSSSQIKSPFAAYHLRQTLGIYITGIALVILSFISILPFIGWLIGLVITLAQVGLFVLWILGLVSAANGEEKPVPILGEYYQKFLKDIK